MKMMELYHTPMKMKLELFVMMDGQHILQLLHANSFMVIQLSIHTTKPKIVNILISGSMMFNVQDLK